MTDINNRKLTVLTVLVAVLLVAVLAQSAAIWDLRTGRDNTSRKTEAAKSTQLVVAQHPADNNSKSPVVRPTDPLDKDPFDWDLNDWDPFKEMQSMQDRIDQMFGSAFNRFRRSDDLGKLFGDPLFSPAINIEDKEDHYLVTVDLPGTEDSRVDVKIDGQTLIVSGSVQSESRQEEKGKMLREERRSGKFERSLTLPGPVQADQIKSRNKKGVLYIEIPKKAEDV